MQLADFRKMNKIRARVDSIVKDKATAEALKPWYSGFRHSALLSRAAADFLKKTNSASARASRTLTCEQGCPSIRPFPF